MIREMKTYEKVERSTYVHLSGGSKKNFLHVGCSHAKRYRCIVFFILLIHLPISAARLIFHFPVLPFICRLSREGYFQIGSWRGALAPLNTKLCKWARWDARSRPTRLRLSASHSVMRPGNQVRLQRRSGVTVCGVRVVSVSRDAVFLFFIFFPFFHFISLFYFCFPLLCISCSGTLPGRKRVPIQGCSAGKTACR